MHALIIEQSCRSAPSREYRYCAPKATRDPALPAPAIKLTVRENYVCSSFPSSLQRVHAGQPSFSGVGRASTQRFLVFIY